MGIYTGSKDVRAGSKKRSYFNVNEGDVAGVYKLQVIAFRDMSEYPEDMSDDTRSVFSPFFGGDFKILEYPEGAKKKPNDEVSLYCKVPEALLNGKPANKQTIKEKATIKHFLRNVKSVLLAASGTAEAEYDEGMPAEAGSEENPLAGSILFCQVSADKKDDGRVFTNTAFFAVTSDEAAA